MTWQPPWLTAALDAIQAGEGAVLVTIAEAKGSTPREPGAKMLVRDGDAVGSIGGGQLELLALDEARRLMREGEAAPRLTHYSLGPDLGQCCGGAVRLLLEPLRAEDRGWLEAWRRCGNQARPVLLSTHEDGRKIWTSGSANRHAAWVENQNGGWRVVEAVCRRARPLWLYGAGHVGRALAGVLAGLDFEVTWLDSRPDGFPAAVPPGIRAVTAPLLAETVADAPPGCIFLVMTHSHQLDQDICHQILTRGDCAFLGLIGSATKRARFLSALKGLGHNAAALERLVCPIGLAQIPGKLPMAIAVSVAAQLLSQQMSAETIVESDLRSDAR